MTPEEIYEESFRIIESEVGPHSFSADEWPVVRRIIHASGDLELARLVEFRGDAVREGIRALRDGMPIVTDVRMVAAGINKKRLDGLATATHCLIDDPAVVQLAQERGLTRSFCAMTLAALQVGEAVYVIGNAPTALTALCIEIARGKARPRLIVAMPVGFVNVVESKDMAFAAGVPCIVVRGRKGGSALAAATVNALMEMALEGDDA